MKKLVYEFGLISFSIIALLEMVPALLNDQKLSGWEFLGLSLNVILAGSCCYKLVTMKKGKSSDAPS